MRVVSTTRQQRICEVPYCFPMVWQFAQRLQKTGLSFPLQHCLYTYWSGLDLPCRQICWTGLDLKPNLCKQVKTPQAPEVPILELAYGVYMGVL